jgi:hypothetical protein
MRKLVLSIAAAGTFAGAALVTGPAVATPVSGLGALNAIAAVDNVEPAAVVCGRWRCWHTWGGPRAYWGGPRAYWGGRPYWRRHWWRRY